MSKLNRRWQVLFAVALVGAILISCEKQTIPPAVYSLSVNPHDPGARPTDPSGTVSVNSGTATPVLATANANHVFSKWTVKSGTDVEFDDALLPSSAVTLMSGDASIEANFFAWRAFGTQGSVRRAIPRGERSDSGLELLDIHDRHA